MKHSIDFPLRPDTLFLNSIAGEIVGVEHHSGWWPLSGDAANVHCHWRAATQSAHSKSIIAVRWSAFHELVDGLALDGVCMAKVEKYSSWPLAVERLGAVYIPGMEASYYTAHAGLDKQCDYRLERPDPPLPRAARFLSLSSSRALALLCLGSMTS